MFTDEWGGGLGARCRANDPNKWGADAIFNLNGQQAELRKLLQDAGRPGRHRKLRRSQRFARSRSRPRHYGAGVVSGRHLDDGFHRCGHPIEIAYFDRGPIDPKMLVLGGDWSAYWYNGHIYASEIARGLDVFELTPTQVPHAKRDRRREDRCRSPSSTCRTSRRSSGPASWSWQRLMSISWSVRIHCLRTASRPYGRRSNGAEDSKLGRKEIGELKSLASWLEKGTSPTINATDSARSKALAEILKRPKL